MTKFVIDTEGVSELAVLLGNKIMNSEFEERKGTSGEGEFLFPNNVRMKYIHGSFGQSARVVLKSESVGELVFNADETVFLLDKIYQHEVMKKNIKDKELREKFVKLFEGEK